MKRHHQGNAETKLFSGLQADTLQRELQETSVKLQTVQSQVLQAENSRVDLQEKKDKVSQLKSQLDTEKLQRYRLLTTNGVLFIV